MISKKNSCRGNYMRKYGMCLIENEFPNKEHDIIQQFKVKVQIF